MTMATATCERCNAQIDADARHCPQCGAPVVPEVERETEILLSQANVARVRKQFAEAEATCVDVLRRDPNNAHAHSLLGDLYRDQARLHDAAQWYRMALDLSSDSPADRAKLMHVEDMIARTQGERTVAAGGSSASKLMGLPHVLWIRVVTAVVVVFLVSVVAVTLAGRARQGSPAARPDSPGALHGATAPGAERGWPIAPPRSPLTTTMPTGAAPAPATPGATAAATVPGAAPGAGTVQQRLVVDGDGRTEHEEALRIALNTHAGAMGGGTVTSVMFVNNDSTVMLVMTRTGALSPASADALRASIVRDAFRVAEHTLQAVPQAQRVAVAVRLTGSGLRPVPAFDGQVDRQSMMGADRGVDPGRLAYAFSSMWWAPDIAPAEDVGAGDAAL
ncbi:MAG TPA: tetratricopeptide repeat protein [Chthonomonadales bacterium]|nr:tetratricopeptide repeat protein [Chthonomonadales bacterium]